MKVKSISWYNPKHFQEILGGLEVNFDLYISMADQSIRFDL